MTLALLALAAVALLIVGRSSLQKAVQAVEAREELQRRWGAYSCIQTMLPQLETQLGLIEQDRYDPQPMIHLELDLAGQHVDLLASDEQAKANVNVLHTRHGWRGADAAAQALLAATGTLLRVELSPLSEEASKLSGRQPYTSPGQFLATTMPAQLIRMDFPEASALAHLTCWGDGKLNYRRASGLAILEITKPLLDTQQVDKLLSLRRQLPGADLNRLAALLDLQGSQRQALAGLLTDTTLCHSLWIRLTRDQRQWNYLAVHEQELAEDGHRTTSKVRRLQW